MTVMYGIPMPRPWSPDSGTRIPMPEPRAASRVLDQARQRLAEVESQLAGHDALVAERDMLRRMVEAAEAVTR